VKRVIAAVGALVLGLATPPSATACSPPFVEPTIAALGPEQVVLVGTTGERVDGGRLFHLERVFNATLATPVVIAFKEGEPIGDCSYPVDAGRHLIIAPFREPDGRLGADLGTLQADPESDAGIGYLAEAVELFGQGYAPAQAAVDSGVDLLPTLVIGSATILGLLAVAAFVIRDRTRTG
jgi:hypothetical protein